MVRNRNWRFQRSKIQIEAAIRTGNRDSNGFFLKFFFIFIRFPPISPYKYPPNITHFLTSQSSQILNSQISIALSTLNSQVSIYHNLILNLSHSLSSQYLSLYLNSQVSTLIFFLIVNSQFFILFQV